MGTTPSGLFLPPGVTHSHYLQSPGRACSACLIPAAWQGGGSPGAQRRGKAPDASREHACAHRPVHRRYYPGRPAGHVSRKSHTCTPLPLTGPALTAFGAHLTALMPQDQVFCEKQAGPGLLRLCP